MKITEHSTIICAYCTYDLAYITFGFYAHSEYIIYEWVDRLHGYHMVAKKPV